MHHRMPAGRGGGSGLVQKVSGPAPKSTPVSSASGPRLTNNVSVKTSCLFCNDPVIIGMREGGPDARNPEKISQLVKNLCVHMQLDNQQLPNKFTRIKFPFCDSCIEPIVELLECQKIIDDANARITTALATIEQIVTDAEFLNPNSSMQPMSSSAALMDQQRFSKLRNMILEVHRKKLIMRRNVRKNLMVQVQPSEDGENMTTNVNPTDIDASTDESAEESALQVGNDCESTQEDEDWRRDDHGQNFSAHEDSSLPPDDQDDENSDIPAISNVRGGPSIVKQETSRESPDGNDIEIESNDANPPSPPIGTGRGSQRRKMLFDSIMMYKITYADGDGDYLQCSRCSHRIPITRYCEKRLLSAYRRMKIHIQNTHPQKKKQGPARKTMRMSTGSAPPTLQKEKVRSYHPKKLHTEPNNGIETNGSGASSSLPLPQLPSCEIPAGASLEYVDIEEIDMIDHSGETSNEWHTIDQENGMSEVDDGSSSDDD